MTPKEKHKQVIQDRRKREKNQRLKSILKAAEKIFFAKGYQKATMDEVALEAEITKTTIYRYFKTKDDLYFALMVPVLEDIYKQLEIVEERLSSGQISSGSEFIYAMFDAVYHSYEISPMTFRISQLFQQQVLLSEKRPNVENISDDKGQINFQQVRSLLRKGIELQLLKEVDVDALSDLLWGMILGVIQFEDIKQDDQRGHRLKTRTFKLAKQVLIDALTNDTSSK